MNNRITYCILFVLILFVLPQTSFSQQKHKPKVVLVLSGGGAKGIAHIPLLQVLDSLKIVPDLIIGNSMGSIIGGLYAMGYSGNDIEKIAKNIDWNKHLGGSMSMSEVSIEEKSEFDNYLGGLDVRTGKPGSITSILSDQNLREYLTELTYPVYNVKDFDSLPIPFKAMATDIVNGKEVILDKGNLGVAMRASMSLPAVFNPVPYKGTLLIDGGVLNNFPTDVAQQMGADIIIGSDVGGGMEPIEKLDSFFSVLLQASMLPSNMKNTENQKRCNILVNHLPNMIYGTADFQQTNEIYKIGKKATKENVDALVELADKLNEFEKHPKKSIPYVKNEFTIDTLMFNGVGAKNLALVKNRINLKAKEKYSVQQLIAAVNRGMGTNLFDQISYSQTSKNNNHIDLTLHALEKSPHKANLSLHFDTYRGVGAIINYTNRNVFGATSRFMAAFDIAEQPRIRLDYLRYLGKRKTWFWNTEIYSAFLNNDVKVYGEVVDTHKYKRYEVNNQLNKTLTALSSYMGFGFNYKHLNVKPAHNPDYNAGFYSIREYETNTLELDSHYIYNTLNNAFYATRGTNIKLFGRYIFNHNVHIIKIENGVDYNFKGNNLKYIKLTGDIEKRFPISRRSSMILGLSGGYTMENKNDSYTANPPVSFTNLSLMDKYALGGLYPVACKDVVPFRGLNEAEFYVDQFTKASLSTQTKLVSNLYAIIHSDAAITGTFISFDRYISNFTSFSYDRFAYDKVPTVLVASAGITASYKTFFGPLNLDVSWITRLSTAKVFFSFGYMFTIK